MSLIKVLRKFRRNKGKINFYSKKGVLLYSNTLENTLKSVFYDNYWSTLVVLYSVDYCLVILDCEVKDIYL